ncbi:MAG: iron complex outerrane recepter protein, partial [Campylobacterota bacterium]|nr:iron complex outerrane recepter protein [Campylobacterota bacterium]
PISPALLYIEEETQINNQTLSDKLFNTTIINQTSSSSNEKVISVRANNYRATEYFEDGIPLYRTANGFTDLSMYRADNTEIVLNAGGAHGLYAPSASGGEIILNSHKIKEGFHAFGGVTLSANERVANALFSQKEGDWYYKLELNGMKRDYFNISKDFDNTTVQPNDERVNSDKEQQDGSLKIGYNINNNSKIAFKVSHQKCEYGNPTQTSENDTPWDKYTRVDDKELNSYWFYYDYKKESLELSVRAYYDAYQDLYNIYDSSSFLNLYSWAPPSTYYDSRLGAITSLGYNFSAEQTGKLTLQVERNRHRQEIQNDPIVKDYEAVDSSLSYMHTLKATQDLRVKA